MIAAAPADEQIAVAAQRDDVAGVDEAVGVLQRRRVGAEIAQRGAVGADVQDVVDDAQRDLAVLARRS